MENQQAKTPSFRDAAGREWHLMLSLAAARRVRAESGVDIGQVADGRSFVELASDDEKLAATLWVLVEKQAERLGVAPEQFAEALDGDTFDAAMEALAEAIVLFTRRHQRSAMRTLLAKTAEAQAKTGQLATTWIETNAERITTEAIEEAMAKLPVSGSASPSSKP